MFKSKAPLLIAITFILFFGCGSDSTEDEQSCNNLDYEIEDGVLIGNLTLNNQQDINDFDWSCINSVSGTLMISSTQAPTLEEPITDLSNLNVIESVGNLIVSYNDDLVNLNGLQNLSITTGGSLTFEYNESLGSLNGLNNLSSSIENISINNNLNLTSISALSNITHASYVSIWNNDSIENLLGLQNIIFVSSVWIGSNNSLVNLLGIPSFDAIDSIDASQGHFTIYYNDNLQSLEGVSGTGLQGKLNIHNNPNLTTLSHLNGLTRTDRFDLDRNNALTSLDGLEDLMLVDGPFQIFQNTSLSDFCAISSLVTIGEINGAFSASQCAFNPTIEEIQAGNCSN